MIPDLSVIWVIAFVLLVSVIFDRLLVRPLMHVMQERERVVRSAREVAETAASQTQMAAAEVDGKTRAARAEVYRQMEQTRREALERRAELLAETRQEAEAAVSEASVRLRTQAAEAKEGLDREAGALADRVVERVLGRKIS